MFPARDSHAAIGNRVRTAAGIWDATMTDIVLSLVMLTALALFAGAFFYWRRTGEVKQPARMVLLVAIANVLIWTVPGADGMAPVEAVNQQ